MRYIIETTDKGNEENVWNTIDRLVREEKITIVEKGDPVEEMKHKLRKIARSLQMLNEIGFDKEVMRSFIYDKTKVAKRDIDLVLGEQEKFFKRLGVNLK